MQENVKEETTQELPEEGEVVELDAEESSEESEQQIETTEPEPVEAEQKSDDELSDYSQSVQKRIAKLTKKMREQERAANSTYEYAQSLQQENQLLKQNNSNANKNYLNEAQNRLASQRAQANSVLKNAYQEQDWDKVTKAQNILDKITVEESKLQMQPEQNYTQQNYQNVPNQMMQQTQQQQEPDPAAEEWASKNEWFGEDETMTLAAFNIHRKLVEEEGFDTSDSSYYDEIDKRMRVEFPHKFSNGGEANSNRGAQQNVAPAGRVTNSGGKRQVKLSASEVEMARRLNVPLKEYAKYIKR